MMKIYSFFSKSLAEWHLVANKRDLPWKGIKDPYAIWLSEVLLQQTKAEQALPYFTAFINAFPTVHHLAKAPTEQVYKLWQGLGYYNRCNNLIATAKHVSANLKGVFPTTYEQIIGLKGVGPYTASAIASFAFQLPYAVVDGNVYRVLSRFFGMQQGFFNAADKKHYTNLAQRLLPVDNAALHNQAIMDFGATICKPATPTCPICPLKKKCKALELNLVKELPVKKPKLTITERHFHYLVINKKNAFYMRKRTDKDIWQNLHEFYLLESKNEFLPSTSEIIQKLSSPQRYTQKLTHQLIYSYFYELDRLPIELAKDKGYEWIAANNIKYLPLPKSIAWYFAKNL
jgi:A/G-specific adenine glycosylase